uniref:Uncharacterized protein n=1 Tax=Meloidogyne javanica TaxID=6303 RepID=A0A915MWH2_MELJA
MSVREPSLDELFQFNNDLENYQNLANEVRDLRKCLQTIQQNRQILHQILATSNQNNQNLAYLSQNTRHITDQQRLEEYRNTVNELLTHSCSNLTVIQDLANSTNIDDLKIYFEILLGQKEPGLQPLLDNLNHQIQTISQTNPSMAQQLREQLENIHRQGENIHHHEAGPSHQVQAGAGPSHQVQAGAGPSHHQGEAGHSHQFHTGAGPSHHQGEAGPSHQSQDGEQTRQNLMYQLFGTPSGSNGNGGSEATPNDSDED